MGAGGSASLEFRLVVAPRPPSSPAWRRPPCPWRSGSPACWSPDLRELGLRENPPKSPLHRLNHEAKATTPTSPTKKLVSRNLSHRVLADGSLMFQLSCFNNLARVRAHSLFSPSFGRGKPQLGTFQKRQRLICNINVACITFACSSFGEASTADKFHPAGCGTGCKTRLIGRVQPDMSSGVFAELKREPPMDATQIKSKLRPTQPPAQRLLSTSWGNLPFKRPGVASVRPRRP